MVKSDKVRAAKPAEGNAMPLCYSYSRWSSPEQSGGLTQARQQPAAVAYAAANGLTMADELTDAGVSGFRGKNIADGGALGSFLAAIEAKKIPVGSVLIVEALDRLGRMPVEDAYETFRAIIRAGVKIHTLQDGTTYERGEKNLGKMFMALSKMESANDESERKSYRSNFNQKAKRDTIKSGKFASVKLPAWIGRTNEIKVGERVVGADFVLIPERAKVVRRIIAQYLDGLGSRQIAQNLNTDKVPCFGCAKNWTSSSVHYLLTTPALIGDYQTAAVSEPVKGYFGEGAALLTKAEWQKLQNAVESRKVKQGCRSAAVVNLFSGLIVDAKGVAYHNILKTSRNRNNYPTLIHKERRDAGKQIATFPYLQAEGCLLACCSEIDVEELTGKNLSAEKQELSGAKEELVALGRKIILTTERAEKAPDIEAILNLLETLDARKNELERTINGLERVIYGADTADIASCKDILATLAETPSEALPAVRTKLRGLIVNLISKIELTTFENPIQLENDGGKMAIFRVFYRHGGRRGILARVVRKGNNSPYRLQSVANLGKGDKPVMSPETFIEACRLADSINR